MKAILQIYTLPLILGYSCNRCPRLHHKSYSQLLLLANNLSSLCKTQTCDAKITPAFTRITTKRFISIPKQTLRYFFPVSPTDQTERQQQMAWWRPRCVDTFNGGAFGQNCDRSHRHLLQLVDRAALGPPAVGSNPQEMAHLVGPLGSIENSSVRACVYQEREYKRNVHLLQPEPASRSCLDIKAPPKALLINRSKTKDINIRILLFLCGAETLIFE